MLNLLFSLESTRFFIGLVIYLIALAVTAVATRWLYVEVLSEIAFLMQQEAPEPAERSPRGAGGAAGARGKMSPASESPGHSPRGAGGAAGARGKLPSAEKNAPPQKHITWAERKEFIAHNGAQVFHKIVDELCTWALIVFIAWCVAISVLVFLR